MKKGTGVRFTGVECKEQIQWGNHTNPDGILEKGETYVISKYEIHSWHTRVYLDGVDGYFNALWFEQVDEAEKNNSNEQPINP